MEFVAASQAPEGTSPVASPAAPPLDDELALRGALADRRTTRLADLPARAFEREDEAPDAAFHLTPRMAPPVDARAQAALRGLYAELLRPSMRVLDLMSSRHSHLPQDMELHVRGHGMNAAELDANPALARRFVQDLNVDRVLPLRDRSFDAVLCAFAVQYLRRPTAALGEAARVLRPEGALVVSFTASCFAAKAVTVWRVLGPEERARYVELAMAEVGLGDTQVRELVPPDGTGDPLWAVVGRAG